MDNKKRNTEQDNIYLDVNEAVEIIRSGGIIIMTDNEERENEGDLVQAAELATDQSITFMAVHGRGLICLPMEMEDAKRLSLDPMTGKNDSLHTTAFTVSIDAREGTTTGISASDRAVTIRKAADPASRPGDFARPGHIFPLVAAPGGVTERDGHTEGSVELVKLSGLRPAAVICEIMDTDGTMARGEKLEQYAKEHSLRILSIERLKKHVLGSKVKGREADRENFMEVTLPTRYGTFRLLARENSDSGNGQAETAEKTLPEDRQRQKVVFALVSGETDPEKETIVRIHSECVTGDILHSLRCDCGEQLEKSMKIIAEKGGILIYMKQEGRGIGFTEKIKAYILQEKGADTVEANIMLGHEADKRNYDCAASFLKKLGIKKIRLLTNNPQKVSLLKEHGFESVEREPLESEANSFNMKYLLTKKEKMGHLLNTR